MKTRPLGKTGLDVTSICIGTASLGNFPSQYGYEVDEERAIATMLRVFEGPYNFIDTSNEYGGGESEKRIGKAMARAGGLPKGYVLATKVDPPRGSKDFSGARMRRSVEESLERLGVDRLELVFLHDPEKTTFEDCMQKGGAVETLQALKDQGVIGHLGVAGGPIDLMLRFLGTGVFEAVISHNRYTLVDQSADPLIDDCVKRGVAFVNAAPFGGGMLVKGPQKQPNYCYRPAGPKTLARVKAMYDLCIANGVPFAAAALQFSLRDPRVTSTIVGITEPQRVEETEALASHPIDEALWQRLLALALTDAPSDD
jgi:D-threo-aldose 1-dehydrogenase